MHHCAPHPELTGQRCLTTPAGRRWLLQTRHNGSLCISFMMFLTRKLAARPAEGPHPVASTPTAPRHTSACFLGKCSLGTSVGRFHARCQARRTCPLLHAPFGPHVARQLLRSAQTTIFTHGGRHVVLASTTLCCYFFALCHQAPLVSPCPQAYEKIVGCKESETCLSVDGRADRVWLYEGNFCPAGLSFQHANMLLGRPLGYCMFSLIGRKRILCRNLFQRVSTA